MADDKQERIETLQDRVDELEATVSKMLPSRRDALKLGAAGAVGAVGMAGSASAQNSGQTGTIGTDADRVDVNAEDIDAVSVNTEVSDVGDYLNFNGFEHTSEPPQQVEDAATNIYDRGRLAPLVIVSGENDGRPGRSFSDLVMFHRRETPGVVGSAERDNPDSRDYTTNENALQLALPNSAGDPYNVQTTGVTHDGI